MSASSASSGYQADLVGSLDASNPKEEVERLIAKTKVVPAVNQLEFHPWVTQLRLAVQKLMRLTYPAQ
jgi:diketogulonate reductase-like aldo/keto reductase